MDSCPEHNKRQNENAQDHWCHTAHKLRNINSIATNTETFKLFPENTKNIQQIMKEALPNYYFIAHCDIPTQPKSF